MEETSSSITVSTKLERIAKLASACARQAAHDAGPSHRRGMAARSVPTHAQGRRDAASTDRARSEYAAALGGQPPVAARPREVRHVPSAARAAGPHPEGRWVANATHRHPHLRGQGPAARGRDGAGSRLRAGVSRLLVRLPAGSLGASGARSPAERVGEDGRRMGPGGRHHASSSTPWTTSALREILRRRVRDGVLLRLIGKWLNAGVMEDGALRYPRGGHAAGRRHLAASGEHLPARGARRVVRARRASLGLRAARCSCATRTTPSWSSRTRTTPAGHGRAAEAIRQVRPDAAPGQDAARAVSPTRPTSHADGGDGGPGHLRPPGLHAPLGLVAQRQVGGEEAHGEGPIQSHATPHRGVVPHAPARRCREQHQAHSRRSCDGHYGVFRRHVELPRARSGPSRGESHLAEVAVSPKPEGIADWNAMHRLLERFPLPRPRIVHPYAT